MLASYTQGLVLPLGSSKVIRDVELLPFQQQLEEVPPLRSTYSVNISLSNQAHSNLSFL